MGFDKIREEYVRMAAAISIQSAGRGLIQRKQHNNKYYKYCATPKALSSSELEKKPPACKHIDTVFSNSDITRKITSYLDNEGIVNLKITCSKPYTSVAMEIRVKKFIYEVTQRNPITVKKMLQDDNTLALIPVNINTYCNRNFNPMTGFQYALWTQDAIMCKILSAFMTPNQIAAQCQALAAVTGNNGNNYNWQQLLRNYTELIHNYLHWEHRQLHNNIVTAWQNICQSQASMPLSVIKKHWYCQSRPINYTDEKHYFFTRRPRKAYFQGRKTPLLWRLDVWFTYVKLKCISDGLPAHDNFSLFINNLRKERCDLEEMFVKQEEQMAEIIPNYVPHQPRFTPN